MKLQTGWVPVKAAPGQQCSRLSLRVFDDDMIIVNMSVWDSVETLREFVFRSEHAGYLRRRSEWFEKLADASTALWWIPEGQTPTVEDAKAKLGSCLRRRHGRRNLGMNRHEMDRPCRPRRPRLGVLFLR